MSNLHHRDHPRERGSFPFPLTAYPHPGTPPAWCAFVFFGLFPRSALGLGEPKTRLCHVYFFGSSPYIQERRVPPIQTPLESRPCPSFPLFLCFPLSSRSRRLFLRWVESSQARVPRPRLLVVVLCVCCQALRRIGRAAPSLPSSLVFAYHAYTDLCWHPMITLPFPLFCVPSTIFQSDLTFSTLVSRTIYHSLSSVVDRQCRD